MRKAMKTKEAISLNQCKECKDGSDCGWDCVESATCSINCSYCNKRVWFNGSHYDTPIPVNFNCPYCKEVIINEYKLHCINIEGKK